MDNSKLEILSNLMAERNLILDILKTVSRDLELKQIEPKLCEILRAKYFAKLDSVDIKLIKEGRKFNCSKCGEPLNGDENILSCLNCGHPFHEYHLKMAPISFENVCPFCGSIYHVHTIDGFVTIELKKLENHFNKLQNKIPLIEVNIEGKPLELRYHMDKLKQQGKDKFSEKCPKCGNIVDPNWQFCKKCGQALKGKKTSKGKICYNCGTIIEPNWHFCKWCGSPTGI